jgi:glycerol-3-phosphate acyltransferase PlsY
MAWLASAAAVLVAYLIGSLSFAVIVSRVMGLSDPRSYGSKNPGATNVLRSGNRVAAALTLALDALKGFVAVIAALLLAPRFGWGENTVAFVGLAAFVGHLWPVFFRFAGGKGVATAAGVLLAFDALLGAATLASWAIVAALSRYASLASIVAAAFATLSYLLYRGVDGYAIAIVAMSLLLVWRHTGNIQKLLAGTESRIGHRAATAAPTPKHHRKGH